MQKYTIGSQPISQGSIQKHMVIYFRSLCVIKNLSTRSWNTNADSNKTNYLSPRPYSTCIKERQGLRVVNFFFKFVYVCLNQAERKH